MGATTLNIVRMITIKVFMNLDAFAANQRVFERRVEWDQSVKFPFEDCVRVFKCLFGQGAVVSVDFL